MKITDLAALTMWLAVLGVAVLAASWIVSQAAGKVRRAV